MSQKNKEITLEDIQKKLSDRWWRLNNLYFIKDEDGNKIIFKPNKVQRELYDGMWFFNIIPKARQLGITTFFAIFYLDQILFSKNKTAGIIAHRQEDMKKIFRDKIRFAWDNLHPWLRDKIGEPSNDSAHELVFPNGSSIFVSMSTRSATVQFLHISEFGYVCHKYPEKAEEIVTGAINSVHAGNMISIESTAKGQQGYFHDFCMKADMNRKMGVELTELDWKIFFFAWYLDPRYTIDSNFAITQEYRDYFLRLEAEHDIRLTDGQKRWYQKKKDMMADKMFSEFPTTLKEAFMVSTEGAYYSNDMNRVYLDNRIRNIPYDPMLEVDTWWDLGMNDFNVILFTQIHGDEIRFIDMYWNSGENLAHYYNILKTRKDKFSYRYGTHNFPHDIEVRDLSSGISRRQTMYNLGMRNIRVATKLGIQDGIDRVRNIFSKFYFDEVKTKKLYESLFNYRKAFDPKLGAFKDKPLHDESSHFVDPVRVLATLWRAKPAMTEKQMVESSSSFF